MSPFGSLTSFFIFLLLSFHLGNPIIHRSERVVKLQYGKLQGFIARPNHNGLGMVEVFLGVPYAGAPVGDLRFMPPTEPIPWSNLKRAERMPPVCPQKLPNVSNKREALKRMPEGRYNYLQRLIPMLRNQSEDCLYLNIYVPVRDTNPRKRVPVLVYIHGESYEWNSGNPYDGSTLAAYGNVIVVTINFRLGVLGFLRPALSASHVSNFGLLDQFAALHWVKENIADFGGNPDSVTIFGHGTGAALANLLLISPVTLVSKGLFQRAILMSGSALSKWALTWDPHKYTIQVAKAVSCPLNDRGDELVRCLRSKTVDELLSVRLQTPPFTTPLGPIVDGIIIKTDPLRSMSIDRSYFGRYELLYGVTLAESYNMLNAAEVKWGMTLDRKNKLLRAYVSNNFAHHASHTFVAILNEYKSYTNVNLPDERNIRDQTLEILSDAQIVAPVVKMGTLHSEVNPKSYFYVFNHQSAYGDYPVAQGTVHGEELAYVFGAPLVGGFSHFGMNYTKDEVFLSELVMMLWTNFAKTGNPNLPTPQGFITPGTTANWDDNMRTLWPPYETRTQSYQNIDVQVVKNSHYRARKLGFWNRLIPDLVSSSGNNRDSMNPSYSFPGATYSTITLIPTVKPDYLELFVHDKTTSRPSYFPVGPKPIKPVQPYREKSTPVPIYPISDTKKETALAEESTPEAVAPLIAGTPIGIVVTVGVSIFCLNCIIMGLIFIYYRKNRVRPASAPDSTTEDVLENDHEKEDSEKKSKKKRRGSNDKNSHDGSSENTSRRSSVSRDSSRESSDRKKHSQSVDLTNIESENPKVPHPIMNGHGHKRSKSDHSLYIDIGKGNANTYKKEYKAKQQQSVKFNTLANLPDKNLNRSTSSIASKSSIKSTSSRTSARSTTSRTSVRSGASIKPIKKNASCQSLPTTEYTWNLTDETAVDPKPSESKNSSPKSENQDTLVSMQKPNCPKDLPDSSEVQCSMTLPRVRPPPPPRSTSLTARDIQELEKLQEAYRKTRSPRNTSSDSCELSGSEPFYSMGGGEAPARAPGLTYGPTLSAAGSVRRISCKSDGADYDQYQKFQQSYPKRDPSSISEAPMQIMPAKSYMTYGENRAPRGPLASFGKIKDQQFPYQISHQMNVVPNAPVTSLNPPPVPAHQVPFATTLIGNQVPLMLPHTPTLAKSEDNQFIIGTPSALFEQTENTGTVKRQKPKTSSIAGSDQTGDPLDKPLKSVLKSTSAYDKRGKGQNCPHNIGPPPSSNRAGVSALPQSVGSNSSTSPSLSSGGGGNDLPSLTELKGILVKRSPRSTAPPNTSSPKSKQSDSNPSMSQHK